MSNVLVRNLTKYDQTMLFSFGLVLILDQKGINKFILPEIYQETGYFTVLKILCPILIHISSFIWKSFVLFWTKIDR